MAKVEVPPAAERLLLRDGEVEEALQVLRNAGLTKIDSIRVPRQLGYCDLAEAERLVHLSETWSDRFQSDENFHDIVEEAANELVAIKEGWCQSSSEAEDDK